MIGYIKLRALLILCFTERETAAVEAAINCTRVKATDYRLGHVGRFVITYLFPFLFFLTLPTNSAEKTHTKKTLGMDD